MASLTMPRFKSRGAISFSGACDSSKKAPKEFGSCNTIAARILPRMRRRKQPNGPFLQASPQIFGDQQPGACVREKVKRLMKHTIPVDSKSLPLSHSIKPAKLPHGIARHSAHDRSSYRSPPPLLHDSIANSSDALHQRRYTCGSRDAIAQCIRLEDLLEYSVNRDVRRTAHGFRPYSRRYQGKTLMHTHNSNRRMGGENCEVNSAAVARQDSKSVVNAGGMSSRMDIVHPMSTSRPDPVA